MNDLQSGFITILSVFLKVPASCQMKQYKNYGNTSKVSVHTEAVIYLEPTESFPFPK